MSIKGPVESCQYLSLGGSSRDKLIEMSNVHSFISDYEASEISIQIINGDEKQEFALDYFKPDYSPQNGEYEKIEYIDNLLYTMELNPPEQVFVTRPDGVFIHLIEGEEINETLIECYDVQSKLNDCIDSLRAGNKLDDMQDAFLRHHNIIE